MRNAAEATRSAPGRISPTRPARSSESSEVPPRYAAPNSLAASESSAAFRVGSQVAPDSSPLSRQRPGFHGQKASSTSSTTSTPCA
nr:hypothetical protein [Streptomyces xiaopingdaonensis]